jgi:DNA-directed RNA polymerase specialized sigma24 family protein
MLESTTISDEIYNLIENRIDRCMFVLMYNWGLTYEEIGHCFNIPALLVKDHIEKAKTAVKAAIDAK